jgi:sulfofructosephosphate aldolase
MVAIDQRESLRVMLRDATGRPVTNADLVHFKVQVARALSAHASALLVDVDYGLEPILQAGVLGAECGLIVAVDTIVYNEKGQGVASGPRADMSNRDWARDAVAALKLLVIWSESQWFGTDATEVGAFVELCRRRRLLSIVEVVVREADGSLPATGMRQSELLVEASRDVARLGPDLYKTEVPFLGRGDSREIVDAARAISESLSCPWVVLSSGVVSGAFPEAVRLSCLGGASGFLAGRGIWGPAVGANAERELNQSSLMRLRELREIAEAAVRQAGFEASQVALGDRPGAGEHSDVR